MEARAQGTRGSRLWPCGQWGLGDLALTAALSAKFGVHPDPDCAVVPAPINACRSGHLLPLAT